MDHDLSTLVSIPKETATKRKKMQSKIKHAAGVIPSKVIPCKTTTNS